MRKNSLVSTWQREIPVTEDFFFLCARKERSTNECDLGDAKDNSDLHPQSDVFYVETHMHTCSICP